jgi:hypothetical protein
MNGILPCKKHKTNGNLVMRICPVVNRGIYCHDDICCVEAVKVEVEFAADDNIVTIDEFINMRKYAVENNLAGLIVNGKILPLNKKRYIMYEKSDFRCGFCHKRASYFRLVEQNENVASLVLYIVKNGKEVIFTKDHITPSSQGGDSSLRNLQAACEDCNNIAGDKRKEG